MHHWISFMFIIGVQLFALALVELKERLLNPNDRDSHPFWQAVAAGVMSGVALGIGFDELIGRKLQLFQYYIHTPGFMVANGALSYGLAVVTALRFSPKPIRAQHLPLRRGFGVLGLTCIATLGFFLLFPDPLTLAGVAGCIVITADEIFETCAFGTAGPILEVASGSLRHLAHNWITAVLVGCIYELGNYFFPVWRWWFTGNPAAIWYELAIVVLGYLVLFHFSRIVGFVTLMLVRRIHDFITERV
jgi:hypothetical protein